MSKRETIATKSNRRLWNNLAAVHIASKFYDVPAFLKGKSSLNPIDRAVLGTVRGKSILHLQCHFGLDTLSLARMGARVTGVDFSDVAIQQARELNDRLQLGGRFILSDVQQLDRVLNEKFDLVYASFGVVGWHSDLSNWARIIAGCLKPKGKFCFAEFHPALWMLSDDHSRVGYSYFKSQPIIEAKRKSYAAAGAKSLGTSYCWNHSLGEVFAALEGHGLIIRNFKEYDYSPYGIFTDGVKKGTKHYIKGLDHMLPLTYSLTASR